MKKLKISNSDKRREEIFNRLEFIENSICEYQQKVRAETATPDEIMLVLTGLYEIKELNKKLQLL